jgi:2-phospho-L-lactate/phosphoenolpyruvate guanylyltransferase
VLFDLATPRRDVPATAILPVKRFDRAKRRLNDQLGVGSRAALASAMFSDVMAALEHSQALEAIMLVSGEPTLADLALGGRTTLIPDITERGQSPAALAGLARAEEQGCTRALLVPGDCPLIEASELDELVNDHDPDEFDVVFVPDRHRHGTNALLLDPGSHFEPRFGPGSLARHVEQAVRDGLRYSVEPVPSLELDVDTRQDLAELIAVLERESERAPHTQAVLRHIERTQQLPAHA